MAYDPVQTAQELNCWQSYVRDCRLPPWEELPDLELYMDQVVSLVCRYLDLMPHDEKNPVLTASAVNNYVRLKVMPAPVRKRYTRRHIACVLMICVLKQSLPLADIQQIFPEDGDEDSIRRIYSDFVEKIDSSVQRFLQQLEDTAEAAVLADGSFDPAALLLHSAVSSVLYKLLTLQLVNLRFPQKNSKN